MGNFVSYMLVPTMDASDVSLSMLVSGIKKEKLQLKEIQSVQQAADNMRIFHSRLFDGSLEDVIKRSYWCSSLCGFPYDKMGFGWGKPTGASFPVRSPNFNGFMLMDTPDGDAIEAIVNLEKVEMEIFENDTEILSICH
ncbi:putative transferase, chloramphenicol acetyltransferase-like domain protein [Tanacetum coccineum]